MAVIKVSERAGDYADQTTATERLTLISSTKAGNRRRFDLMIVCFFGEGGNMERRRQTRGILKACGKTFLNATHVAQRPVEIHAFYGRTCEGMNGPLWSPLLASSFVSEHPLAMDVSPL